MTEWIIIGGYVVAWFFAARLSLTTMAQGAHDREDLILCAVLACAWSAFWPLALPVWLVMATRKPSQRERENALLEREARIASLERELGIGQPQRGRWLR